MPFYSRPRNCIQGAAEATSSLSALWQSSPAARFDLRAVENPYAERATQRGLARHMAWSEDEEAVASGTNRDRGWHFTSFVSSSESRKRQAQKPS
mmetsp:Transcript_1199/g.3474  ORF Transcript_1199/g.3474 Transcript_1199/m.3474 type:complete len:95 (-) Transcript_1199:1240-1524(-)